MRKFIILIMVLFVSVNLSAKKLRALTLYGKFDPRLYAYVTSTYRSQSPDKMRENYKECTRSDWNTGGARRTLTYDIADIVPDKNGTYRVTIPIDYVGKDKCGWEYVDTVMEIRRDKKDKSYVEINIANIKNRYNNSRGEYDDPGSVGVLSPSTKKKHFLLSSGSKIECHTEWHPTSKTSGGYVFKEHAVFICTPKTFNNINGVDEFKTDSINIDIVVNEKKCVAYAGLRPFKRGGYKDYFRDYKEPVSRFKQLKLKVKHFINSIFQ